MDVGGRRATTVTEGWEAWGREGEREGEGEGEREGEEKGEDTALAAAARARGWMWEHRNLEEEEQEEEEEGEGEEVEEEEEEEEREGGAALTAAPTGAPSAITCGSLCLWRPPLPPRRPANAGARACGPHRTSAPLPTSA